MKKLSAGKWLLAVALTVQLFFAASASAAATITWGEEQEVIYDKLHPFTLNWSGDVLDRGGLNLATLELTSNSSEADIVINQYGSMGANGILELEDEDLQDPTDGDLAGFTNSVTIKKGGVYLVVLHDGTYAKIRIDRYLPENGLSINKVYFTYVMEEEIVDEEETPGNAGTDDLLLELGDPLNWDEAEAVYEFEEGEITLPWNAQPGHVSWDIFRSDNGDPWVKMTDFRLTEPEYVDKYTIAGHVYIYKFAAYNSAGEVVLVSPPVIVSIVEAGSGSESVGGDVIVMQLNSTSASVNGKAVKLEVAPFLHDGRTVVPLRFVSEALGAEVKWNDKEKSITLIRGSDKMKLTLNRSDATVNGKTVYMDVPAINHKGLTMVPIRFVVENFHLEIEFDNDTGVITISSEPLEQEEENGNGAEESEAAEEESGDASAYFIGAWAMWVPGTGISTGEGGAFLPGADAGTLTIYEDGTYTYPWNGKLLSGEWKRTGKSNQIVLLNYKFDSDWTVTRTDEGITVSTSPGLREEGVRIE